MADVAEVPKDRARDWIIEWVDPQRESWTVEDAQLVSADSAWLKFRIGPRPLLVNSTLVLSCYQQAPDVS